MTMAGAAKSIGPRWPESSSSRWSADEDAALIAAINYGMTREDVAMISGRTVGSVKNRQWRLGLLENGTWSDEETKILIEGYKAGTVLKIDELCLMLGRSKAAVHVRASRLGLGDWNRPMVEQRKIKVPKFSCPIERSAHLSIVRKENLAKNGHPRGMLGRKHTDEAKLAISKASLRSSNERTPEQLAEIVMKSMRTRERNGTMIKERPGTSWKAAWREIGGIRKYYRSKWEANYAYYLEWLKQGGHIASWTHEPKTFWFEGVKRGCVSYLPDFHVIENDGSEAYHEVKGWMDDRSKTKIRRMAKYHPTVKLIVIESKAYAQLKKKVSGLVPGWEP